MSAFTARHLLTLFTSRMHFVPNSNRKYCFRNYFKHAHSHLVCFSIFRNKLNRRQCTLGSNRGRANLARAYNTVRPHEVRPTSIEQFEEYLPSAAIPNYAKRQSFFSLGQWLDDIRDKDDYSSFRSGAGSIYESNMSALVQTLQIQQATAVSGQKAKAVLENVAKHIKPGITTHELDEIAVGACLIENCYPSPLGYKNFPKAICTSVNDVAIHGIPDNRKLEDGDIINVDVTVFYGGCHGDTSRTYLVGDVDVAGRRLVSVAEESLCRGIAECGPNNNLMNIGDAIQRYVEGEGFKVVPHICGHGIGQRFHLAPDIYHVKHFRVGTMIPGMIFTIEPVITEGDVECELLDDSWTLVSKDGRRSAQFEHTILITYDGCLTLTGDLGDEAATGSGSSPE